MALPKGRKPHSKTGKMITLRFASAEHKAEIDRIARDILDVSVNEFCLSAIRAEVDRLKTQYPEEFTRPESQPDEPIQ